MYILYSKIHVNTWTCEYNFDFLNSQITNYINVFYSFVVAFSFECLYGWKSYLKLAVPGMIAMLIEWSNYEIGTFAAAGLDKNDLAVIAIAQQVMFIGYQVNFSLLFENSTQILNSTLTCAKFFTKFSFGNGLF